MNTYVCDSCGAKILLNEMSHVSTCLYCGNTIVVHNEKMEDMNIKKIIPFQIGKEEAIQKLVRYGIRDEVVDAKKIYVPVRFCSYNYDYLYNFEYRVENEDDNGHRSYSYYDADILLEGTVKNEFVFGTSKVSNICLEYEFRFQPRVDYNLGLIQDVSIEIVNFNNIDFLKQKEKDLKRFSSRYFLRYDISKVYSENYFLSGFDIDSYSTLLPVYVLKTNRNVLYNVPGVLSEEKNYPSFLQIYRNKICIIFVIGAIFSFYTFSNIFFSIFILILMIIFLGLVPKLPNINTKNYDHYTCKQIKFSPKRKKLK